MKDLRGNEIFASGSMIVGMRDTTIHEDGSVDVGTCLDFKVAELSDEAIVLRDGDRTLVFGWGLLEAFAVAFEARAKMLEKRAAAAIIAKHGPPPKDHR